MAITSRRGAWEGVIENRPGSVTAALSERRATLRIILASGALLIASGARAQKTLTTPRGTGRPPIRRSAELPLATDLRVDAVASNNGSLPILLFFDRVECPYCERALREYLVPLSREAWKNRALFRQVEIDRALPLVDFEGRATTHARLAERYRVTLSPTVVIVDGSGNVLADPIVGLTTVDFYGAYLEKALEDAASKL